MKPSRNITELLPVPRRKRAGKKPRVPSHPTNTLDPSPSKPFIKVLGQKPHRNAANVAPSIFWFRIVKNSFKWIFLKTELLYLTWLFKVHKKP